MFPRGFSQVVTPRTLGLCSLETLVNCWACSVSAFQVSYFVQLHLRVIMFFLSFGVSGCPQPYLRSPLFLHHHETTIFLIWLDPCIEIRKNMFMLGATNKKMHAWVSLHSGKILERCRTCMEVQLFFSETQYCQAHPVYLAQL